MSEQGIPVLQEHQAPELSTRPGEYTPTDEEKKAVKLVERLFEKAKKHRKKYDEKWLDYYKMFRGKQWKEQRPSYRHSEVINFIFQAIQSTVPIMTDARQRFEFLPEEPQDMEVAEILSQVAEADWERGNWLYRLSECLFGSHIYGTTIAEMGFNPDAKLGAGGITFDPCDVFYCFPDPEARQINDDKKRSRYFVYAEPTDLEKLKREYPEKRDYLKPDLVDLMQGDKTDLDQVRFKSPVDNKTVIEGTSAYEVGHENQALKVTCYLYSDEFVEEEKERLSPEGQAEKVFIQKLKYPNGRKICMASGVILSDGPIPYDDGLFPFAKLVNYIDPLEFWGISEIEQLESPQKIFNKLVSFSLDVMTLMGNPIWVVDNDSGIDTDNLFNRPGLIVEKNKGSEVRREEGVHLQPYVLQLIDRLQGWFDNISGSTDVTRGVRPEGVTAAAAIADLQEAAQTRIRLKSRNMDAFLQDLGQLYKNRVFQFYSAPRIIRLTSNQGAQKYFKFHVERVQDEAGNEQKKVFVRDFVPQADPVTGQVVGMAEATTAKEYILRGDFDVRVSTGSSLPFAKTAKSNLAFKLFEAGAIDQPELLESVEYPNAEAVWQRVEARQMEKMAKEAALQAPPMPPGGTPAPGAEIPPLPPA